MASGAKPHWQYAVRIERAWAPEFVDRAMPAEGVGMGVLPKWLRKMFAEQWAWYSARNDVSALGEQYVSVWPEEDRSSVCVIVARGEK